MSIDMEKKSNAGYRLFGKDHYFYIPLSLNPLFKGNYSVFLQYVARTLKTNSRVPADMRVYLGPPMHCGVGGKHERGKVINQFACDDESSIQYPDKEEGYYHPIFVFDNILQMPAEHVDMRLYGEYILEAVVISSDCLENQIQLENDLLYVTVQMRHFLITEQITAARSFYNHMQMLQEVTGKTKALNYNSHEYMPDNF